MFKRKREKDEDASPESEERSIKLQKSKAQIHQKREVRKKPWGKTERFFVLAMVGGTALIAFALAFVARDGKLPGLPRVSAPSLGLRDTVVLTKSQVPPDLRNRQNEIITQFSTTTAELSGIYAFSAIDIKSGDSYGVNEFEVIQAASLIKLPLMALLMKDAEEGRINLDASYTLQSSDRIAGAGAMQYQEPGTVVTYRKMLEYMGKQSDNTAFGIMRRKLGDSRIEAFIKEVGMKNTSLSENMTTPADMSMLLQKLYDGRILNTRSRDELFDYLTDTSYEQHLPKGIDPSVRVVHKYGREVHVVNDAGIVYAANPYIVVIMTSGVVETEADTIFPTLSQIIYQGEQL